MFGRRHLFERLLCDLRCLCERSDNTILQEQCELLRSQHDSLLAKQHDEAQLRVAEMGGGADAGSGGGGGTSAGSRVASRAISAQTLQLERLVGELADELEQARCSEKAALTQLYALTGGGIAATAEHTSALAHGDRLMALPLSIAGGAVEPVKTPTIPP
eukprot:SAG11_NODE_2798_length_2958_cov_2.445261_2_plen_160_part_00